MEKNGEQEAGVKEGRSRRGDEISNKSKREIRLILQELQPYTISVFIQVCYAGYNIVSKVSLNKGMSPYVLVVYAHAFGSLATALLALLFKRNNKSKITLPVLRNIFLLGLSGMEKLEISRLKGKAKIGGTLVAFAGATVMILYKGMVVISTRTGHWHHFSSSSTSKAYTDVDWIKGSAMLFISYLASAAFFILQTTTIKMYPAPIRLAFSTCLMGTLQSAVMAAILDHKTSSWTLSWEISLLAPVYSGIVIFGITTYLTALVLREKGSIFFTAFKPLSTLICAIMVWCQRILMTEPVSTQYLK